MKKSKREDKHHIWFPKSDYNKGYLKALRTHWYCVVKIPKATLHSKIHHELLSISPPSGSSAKFAYEHLLMLESYGALKQSDSISKRLNLLIALFECSDMNSVRDLKKQRDIIDEFCLTKGEV